MGIRAVFGISVAFCHFLHLHHYNTAIIVNGTGDRSASRYITSSSNDAIAFAVAGGGADKATLGAIAFIIEIFFGTSISTSLMRIFFSHVVSIFRPVGEGRQGTQYRYRSEYPAGRAALARSVVNTP